MIISVSVKSSPSCPGCLVLMGEGGWWEMFPLGECQMGSCRLDLEERGKYYRDQSMKGSLKLHASPIPVPLC